MLLFDKNRTLSKNYSFIRDTELPSLEDPLLDYRDKWAAAFSNEETIWRQRGSLLSFSSDLECISESQIPCVSSRDYFLASLSNPINALALNTKQEAISKNPSEAAPFYEILSRVRFQFMLDAFEQQRNTLTGMRETLDGLDRAHIEHSLELESETLSERRRLLDSWRPLLAEQRHTELLRRTAMRITASLRGSVAPDRKSCLVLTGELESVCGELLSDVSILERRLEQSTQSLATSALNYLCAVYDRFPDPFPELRRR